MTYFADLTSYAYWDDSSERERVMRAEPWPGIPLFNVGWLSAGQPFDSGPTPPGLLDALGELAKVRVHQTRGHHWCELCVSALAAGAAVGRGDIARESAEFRVRGDGVVYAVPQLVLHYIADHAYLPPAEFVAAVLGAETEPPLRQRRLPLARSRADPGHPR